MKRPIVRRCSVSYIAGTGIPTEAIYSLAKAGWTYQRIQSDGYPVTRVQIDAAVKYERSLRMRIERFITSIRIRLAAWLLGTSVESIRESGL